MKRYFAVFMLFLFSAMTLFGGMITFENTKGMMKDNRVTTLAFSSNTLFAGTENGLTIISYDATIETHDIGKVLSICPVQNRTLIATEKGIYLYANGDVNFFSKIPATSISYTGNMIYMGTKGCHVSSFPAKELFSNKVKPQNFSVKLPVEINENRNQYFITDILSDSLDNLWIATSGAGLIKRNVNGEYTIYSKEETGSLWITSLSYYDGNVLAGTAKGLVKIDNQDVDLISFPKTKSLYVSQLVIDGNKLFIASSNGVYRYNGEKVEKYTEDKQFPSSLTSIGMFGDLVACGTPYGIWIEEERLSQEELLEEINLASSFNPNEPVYFEKEFVVCFKEGISEDRIEELNREYNCEIIKQNPLSKTYRLKIQSDESVDSLVKSYQKSPLVDYSEPEYIISISEVEINDPFYVKQQKNLKTINFDKVYPNLPEASSIVKVAVVDTGVHTAHEDLDDICLPGYNVIDNNTSVADDQGHGTHCAGIIAAEINNGAGIAGINKFAKIIPVKVMNSSGKGTSSDVAEGILWAANNGAQVINLSLGSAVKVTAIERAVQTAHSKGIAIFGAAGNNGKHQIFYPGGFAETLCVGAVDNTRKLASFSNYGKHVDLVAPGVQIASTYYDKNNPSNKKHYVYSSGTSMACPHVAGVASILLSLYPDLKVEDLYTIILKASVVDEYTTTALGPCKVPLYSKSAIVSTQSLGDFLSNFLKFVSGLFGGNKKDPEITRQGDWDPKLGYGVLDLQKAIRLAEEKTVFENFNRLNLKKNR